MGGSILVADEPEQIVGLGIVWIEGQGVDELVGRFIESAGMGRFDSGVDQRRRPRPRRLKQGGGQDEREQHVFTYRGAANLGCSRLSGRSLPGREVSALP